MEELRLKVVEWAKDRGILEKSSPKAQSTKVAEECLELLVADMNADMPEIKDAVGDIMVTIIIESILMDLSFDDLNHLAKHNITTIGYSTPIDIMFASIRLCDCLIMEDNLDARYELSTVYSILKTYCEKKSLSLEECLQGAYDVISKRKGKMVNGVFVKDN